MKSGVLTTADQDQRNGPYAWTRATSENAGTAPGRALTACCGLAKLAATSGAGADAAYVTSFRPMIPERIRPMHMSRSAVAGSANK